MTGGRPPGGGGGGGGPPKEENERDGRTEVTRKSHLVGLCFRNVTQSTLHKSDRYVQHLYSNHIEKYPMVFLS